MSDEQQWSIGKVREAFHGTDDATAVSPSTTPNQTPAPASSPNTYHNPIVGAAVRTNTASRAVGKITAGIAEIAVIGACEKPDKKNPHGYIVDECDEDDLHDLENAAAEGFQKKFPDADVPWWLGMVLATGNLYLGARRSRRPREVALPGATPVNETPQPETKPNESTHNAVSFTSLQPLSRTQ